MQSRKKTGIDHRQLRAINQRRVLRLLHQRGGLTRKELATSTGLDSKSITNIIRDLRANETIAVAGRKKSDGGRSVDVFELRRDRSLALGIHIAADRILALVTNPYGQTLWQSERMGRQATVDEIRALVTDLAKNLFSLEAFCAAHFVGAGICAPGLLNEERTGWVMSHQLPELVGHEPGRWLEEATGLAITLEDDSAAKAMGERLWGAGQDHRNFLLVDLDTGVGSGIVIAGKLFRGVMGHSGEIGRLRIHAGLDSSPGMAGKCLEEAVGLHAITAQYNDRNPSQLAQRFEDVLARSRSGDKDAIAVIEAAGRLIGSALANIFDFLNVPILLTGRLVNGTDAAFPPIKESFLHNILMPEGEISVGHLNDRVGALGAAALVYHGWLEQ